MMRNVLFVIIVLMAGGWSGLLKGQELNWGFGFGGTSMDVVKGVATDTAGNVYSVGYYLSNPVIDPDSSVFEWPNMGSSDIFITRHNAAGNLVWGKSIGALNRQRAHAVVTDESGYIYVTGEFQNIVDFDPDPLRFYYLSPLSAGSTSMFLLKMDSTGTLIWAKDIGVINTATFGMASGHAITVDRDGNLVITGEYSSAIDFDPGPQQTILTGGTGLHEVFVAKYDRNGNFIWAVPFSGGTSLSVGYAVKTDADANIYVGGSFQGTVDFDPGNTTTYPLSSTLNIKDAFLCKLATDGSFRWAFSLGSIEDDYISGLVLDDSANVYVTGRFWYTVDFDPDPIGTASRTSNGGNDIFLSKYDSAGRFRWAHSFGGAGTDIGHALAIDPGGNLYLGGCYQGMVDFDPGSNTNSLTSQAGTGYEFLIAKYDRSGVYAWATGNSGAARDGYISGLDLDVRGNLCAVGSNTGAGTITIGNNSFDLPGNGDVDVFVLQIPCDNASTPSFVRVTTCDSFAYSDVMYYVSGTYPHLFRNLYGCDSLVTLELVIRDLEPRIAVSEDTLSTLEPYMSYRWLLDGDAIPGAIHAVHIAVENGDYQVVVGAADGCTDTSAVYAINNISVGDIGKTKAGIRVYPNPVSDVLYVTSPGARGRVVLSNLAGQQVMQTDFPGAMDVKTLPAGMYLLLAYDESGRLVYTGKIIR